MLSKHCFMSRIAPKRSNVSKNVFYTDVGFILRECSGYYTFWMCISIFVNASEVAMEWEHGVSLFYDVEVNRAT